MNAYLLWLIAELLAPAPNRALAKDTAGQAALVGHFENAGERYDLDPDLLMVWMFGESSFRTSAAGALGEVGIAQIHGRRNRRQCRDAGHSLDGAEGQIHCGAMLLSRWRGGCGSLKGGLLTYTTGSCTGNPKGSRIYQRRTRQLARWRAKWLKE